MFLNRTSRSGEMYPVYFRKEDILCVLESVCKSLRASGHKDEREALQWKTYSPSSLGKHIVCWGADGLGDFLHHDLCHSKAWTCEKFFGVMVEYDEDILPNRIILTESSSDCVLGSLEVDSIN